MSRDEIIKMAESCSAPEWWEGRQDAWHMGLDLERFAALVVSHHVKETRPKPDDSERKWLQQIAYQHGGIGDLCETEFEFGALVAEAEREACAKVCEGVLWPDSKQWAQDFAAAIRARGDK